MAEEMEIEWIEENMEDTASARPLRASHIRSCCVEGCKSKGYRLLVDGERVQYFGFPLYDSDLCERWAATVKLAPGVAFAKSFVCSKHFIPADFRARPNDESKRMLRRSAIPSLEHVVGLTPPAYRQTQRRTEDDTTEDSEEESLAGSSEITAYVNQNTQDGDSLTVLVVKNPNDTAAEAEEDLPALIKEKKRLPIICKDTLKNGPPYPWHRLGIKEWVEERMPYHEEHLQKVRDAITEETVLSAQLEKDCEERMQLLSLVVIKKGEGRLTLKNFVKAMVD